MPRYKLTIEYDGTDFSGWQIQPDARTVEGELEKAFSQILQIKTDIVGQGRTDAGVHAKAQIAHVDLPEEVNPGKLIFGVNGLVGSKIHIHHIENVEDKFHSRFDASARMYEYRILKHPSPLHNQFAWWPGYQPDPDLLNACAKEIPGERDFQRFSKFNEDNFTTLCTVTHSEWEEREDEWIYSIKANRFLRNMVRRLAGTMIEVATDRMNISDFKSLLEEPEKDIRSVTAPAKGLTLINVYY